MFTAIDPIETVVCTHNRPRLGGFNSNFKALKVNLPQGAVVDHSIHVHAPTFLVIYRKVL